MILQVFTSCGKTNMTVIDKIQQELQKKGVNITKVKRPKIYIIEQSNIKVVLN